MMREMTESRHVTGGGDAVACALFGQVMSNGKGVNRARSGVHEGSMLPN